MCFCYCCACQTYIHTTFHKSNYQDKNIFVTRESERSLEVIEREGYKIDLMY